MSDTYAPPAPQNALSDADKQALAQTYTPAASPQDEARSALANVSSVKAPAASAAIAARSATTLPPAVSMYDPISTADAVRRQQQSDAINGSPAVADWVRGADPAHVATAQDELPSLAKIGQSIQDFMNAPWRQLWEAAKAGAPHTPTSFSDSISEAAKNLFSLPGLAIGLGGNIVNPFGSAVQTQAEQVLQKFLGPKLYNQISSDMGTALAGIGAPEAGLPAIGGAAGPEFANVSEGKFATAAEAARTFRETPPPEGTRWEVNRTDTGYQLTPVPLEEPSIGPAPPGVKETEDTLNASRAALDAGAMKKMEDTIAESPIAAQSPETMKDFLEKQPGLEGQTAYIDAGKLNELVAEGKTTKQGYELVNDIAQSDSSYHALLSAIETHSSYAMSLSDYLAAMQGHPDADAIREITRFSEDGVSQADAKELWKPEPDKWEAEPETSLSTEEAPREFIPGPIEHDPELSEGENAALKLQEPTLQIAAKQAAQEIYLKGAFADAKALGMSEPDMAAWSGKVQAAQQAIYDRLITRAKANLKKFQTPEWKTTYAKHFGDVANGYSQRPAIVAYNQLKSSATATSDLSKDNPLVKNGVPITFYRATNLHDTGDGEVPLDLFANPRPPQVPHPYWKTTVELSHYKGASFAENPDFASGWSSGLAGYEEAGQYGAGTLEKRPVIWVNHVKPKALGDFRNAADVEKALDWWKKKNPQASYESDTDRHFQIADRKRELEKGSWSYWEIPEMMHDLGWDAVRMVENQSQDKAKPNLFVTNPEAIYWKYDSGAVPTKVRLSQADRAFVPKELLDRLPKGIWDKDGESLDSFAEQLGFDSGEAMLQELASIEDLRGKLPFKEWLERQMKAEAAERAKDELGWDLSPQSLLAQAKELVDAPQVEDLLTDSLRALAYQVGRPINLADIKSGALDRFASLPVAQAKDIKGFERAVRDNGRKVEQGLLRGKPDALLEAFENRQAQVINYYMLAEAHKLATEYGKFQTAVGRWSKNEIAKTVDPDFVNQMHALLAQVGISIEHDFAHLTEKLQETPYGDFSSFWNDHGMDLSDDPLPRNQYGNVEVGGMEKASVADFRDFFNTLKQLVHMGRVISAGTMLSEKASLADLVAEARGNLGRRPPNITHIEIEHPTTLQALAHWLREVDSWLLKMEQMFIDLDYRDPHGPFNRAVVLPLESRKGWADDAHRVVADHFRELAKKTGREFPKWLRTRIDLSTEFPEFVDRNGDPYFGTNADILGAALHTGSEGNWQVLMRSWPGGVVSRARFSELFRRMTPEAWQYAQGMWDIFAHFKPALFQMYERINGIPMTEVPAQPFKNAHGSFAGGYYPVTRSALGLPKSYVNPDKFLGQVQYFRAKPANPHGKERTDSRSPLDLKLQHGRARLEQVIHDIAFREVLSQVDRFLGDANLKAAVVKKYGPEYYGRMQDLIRKIAGSSVFNADQSEVALNLIEGANRNAIINLIGYSTQTVMKHVISALGDSAATVGKGPMVAAIHHMFTHWEDFWNFVLTNSPEVRNRVMNVSENAREAYLQILEKQGPLAAIQRGAFDWVAGSDQISAAPVWWAEYWKHVTDPNVSHERAVALADQQVRQAHGASSTMDSAPYLRLGRERTVPAAAYRAMVSLMNFFSHKWNRGRELPQDLFGTGGYKPNPARGLNNLIFIFAVAGLSEKEISEWYGSKIRNWFEALYHIPLSGLPFANDIVSAVTQQEHSGDSLMLEAAGAIGSVARDAGQVAKGEQPKRPIEDTAQAFGSVTGFPGKQVGNTLQFLSDYMTGREQNVHNPVDFIHGAITGPQGLVPPSERGKPSRGFHFSLRGFR